MKKIFLISLLAAITLPIAVNSEEYILCPDFLVKRKGVQNFKQENLSSISYIRKLVDKRIIK